MRRIRGNDNIFSKLIRGSDEVTYNLFYLIREDENGYIVTDDKSYIIAQSNNKTPMWVWTTKDHLESKSEIAQIIEEHIKLNSQLKVVGNEKCLEGILKSASEKADVQFSINMPMNAYYCTEVNHIDKSGKLVIPDRKYRNRMAELIYEMVFDALKMDISKEECYKFADNNADSKNLFLWQNENKEIVSMANISHKNSKYARINDVVTDRTKRNKGYGAMLVSSVSDYLLNENIIPILYADARNSVSNSLYLKIGYKKAGEVTEYQFHEK